MQLILSLPICSSTYTLFLPHIFCFSHVDLASNNFFFFCLFHNLGFFAEFLLQRRQVGVLLPAFHIHSSAHTLSPSCPLSCREAPWALFRKELMKSSPSLKSLQVLLSHDGRGSSCQLHRAALHTGDPWKLSTEGLQYPGEEEGRHQSPSSHFHWAASFLHQFKLFVGVDP